jgi:hypothetical protein
MTNGEGGLFSANDVAVLCEKGAWNVHHDFSKTPYFAILNPIHSLTKELTMFHHDFSTRSAKGILTSEQRVLSRRQFLRTSAGVAGAAFGASLLWPGRAWARHHVAPRPIPGGQTVVIGDEQFFIHSFPIGPDEPSKITDLNGHASICRILGSGLGIDTDTGEARELLFRADMGFMTGKYVAEDEHLHDDTFAFV